MIKCEDIFDYYQKRSQEQSEEKFELIFRWLCYRLGDILATTEMSSLEKVLSIKDLYIYTSKQKDSFFKYLELYNYNFKQEIKDAINYLGNLDNPNNNKGVIEKFLKSPYIDDISFNGNSRYKIISSQFGEYTFDLLRKRFNGNFEVKFYMHQMRSNQCHNNTYFIRNHILDARLITSLCPYYFKGLYYYHSYAIDLTCGNVIDLCSKIEMPKVLYDELYEPTELVNIDKNEINKLYQEVLSKIDISKDTCHLLAIALYNQLMSLEDNPEEKEKITEFINTRCRK